MLSLGGASLAHLVQCGQRLLVRVRQRVEVLLRCGDLLVTQSLLHDLEVSAAGEQPRCVGVPQVMHPDMDLDLSYGESWHPDTRAEPVARDVAVGVAESDAAR